MSRATKNIKSRAFKVVRLRPYEKLGILGILGNLGNGSELSELSESSEFSMCAYVTDGKLGTKKLGNLE